MGAVALWRPRRRGPRRSTGDEPGLSVKVRIVRPC
jgi:hypothetical protein